MTTRPKDGIDLFNNPPRRRPELCPGGLGKLSFLFSLISVSHRAIPDSHRLPPELIPRNYPPAFLLFLEGG
jgi:hypothetical protein